MKEAQQKKDLELAERIKLADEKLASVTKLEQENTNLKAALGKKKDLEADRKSTRLNSSHAT